MVYNYEYQELENERLQNEKPDLRSFNENDNVERRSAAESMRLNIYVVLFFLSVCFCFCIV